jgi:hypothetical protein
VIIFPLSASSRLVRELEEQMMASGFQAEQYLMMALGLKQLINIMDFQYDT